MIRSLSVVRVSGEAYAGNDVVKVGTPLRMIRHDRGKIHTLNIGKVVKGGWYAIAMLGVLDRHSGEGRNLSI